MAIREFLVTGRQTPTEANAEPRIFRMRLFAANDVAAKSRFWYFMKQQNRVKKANGQILDVTEVFHKGGVVARNYGIMIRFQSNAWIHNMYKEYRATSTIEAVEKMYAEMAGQHRARFSTIQIIKVAEVSAHEARKNQEFRTDKIAFPVMQRRLPTDKKVKAVAHRPNLF